MKKKRDKKPLQIAVLLRRLLDTPGRPSEFDVLGQCERAALAAALKLSLELSAEVTAIAVGPARMEDRVMAIALRAGCHRAVRIYGDELESVDAIGVARVIAAAMQQLSIDLVLCGDRSQEQLHGALGPAVAEIAGIAHMTGLVDVRGESDHVVARHRAHGQLHNFQCRWPAVLCIHSFPRSRHPRHGTSSLTAGTSIQELSLDTLGLSAADFAGRQHVTGSSHERRKGRNAVLARDAADLVSRLRTDHLLP